MIDELGMATLIKKDIEKSIVLLGEQSFLIDEYTKLIVKKINSDYKDIEYVSIEYLEVDNDFIRDTVECVGFLYEKKFIHIKGVDIVKINLKDLEELAQILNANVDNFILISTNESDEKTKVNSFAKKFNDNFITVNLTRRKQQDVIKMIEKRCQKNNVQIKKNVCEYLINMTTQSLGILVNEVDKLCNYKVSGEILISDIDYLTTKTVEQSIFLLIDFTIKKDLKSAINLYNSLIDSKEQPISILSVLSVGFIDLYRYKLNMKYGGESNFLVENYRYKKTDFRLKKASWNYNKLTQKQLDMIMTNIYETERRIKTQNVNAKIEVEILIINIVKISLGNF